MKIPRELATRLVKFERKTDTKPWRECFEELYELELEDDKLISKLNVLRDKINAKLDKLIDELSQEVRSFIKSSIVLMGMILNRSSAE